MLSARSGRYRAHLLDKTSTTPKLLIWKEVK